MAHAGDVRVEVEEKKSDAVEMQSTAKGDAQFWKVRAQSAVCMRRNPHLCMFFFFLLCVRDMP